MVTAGPRDLWTNDLLAAQRERTDPVADQAVMALFDRGRVDAVNALLATLVRNEALVPSALDPVLHPLLDATTALPEWADPAMVRAGEGLFVRHGMLSLVSLLCAALPECYAMRNAVQVLGLTHKAEAQTRRRLYETAQMVINVMSPGGLGLHPDDHGRGLRAAQKVRLMHAAIRHLILTEPPPDPPPPRGLGDVLLQVRWNPAWGQPINQEDMAYTILTFSWVILRSLERLGARVSPDEARAYLHCWNVVGHVLGVRRELHATTPEEAEDLFTRIHARQQGATPEGRRMTAALLATVRDRVGVPGLGAALPPFLVRTLLDGPTSDLLGVPPPGAATGVALGALLHALRATVGAVAGGTRVPGVAGLEARVGRWWIERLVALPVPDWKKQLFYLPTELAAAWGIGGAR